MSDYVAADLGDPQRQSVWAIAFLAFRTLRSIGLVQLVLFVGFVVARLPSVLAVISLAAVIGVALFIAATLRWWRYTFHIAEGELIVRRGVLQQQRLTIPLGRVQSVSLEQKLLHRVASLVQISLETAGTETAEFVIDAVDRNVARTLQQRVANYRSDETPGESSTAAADIAPPPPERVVVKHPPRRIIKIALAQSPFAGLVLIAPLFALGDEIGRVVPFDLPSIDEPSGFRWLFWFVPLALVAGMLVSLVLNLVRVLLTDWGLTLRSTASGLRRDAGLISTTSVATPVPRVQILNTRQNPIEGRWDLQRVDLTTIGDANLAIPGCSAAEAQAIRELVLAGSQGAEQLTERVSSAEIFLHIRNTTAAAALSAAGLWFVIGRWSLIPLLLVPYVAVTVRRRVRLRRWGISADAIAVQNEFVSWKRQEILLRKINSITVGQRLFERSRGLATVTFATAAGTVSVGMIPLDQAEEIRDRALFCVETDRRPWM